MKAKLLIALSLAVVAAAVLLSSQRSHATSKPDCVKYSSQRLDSECKKHQGYWKIREQVSDGNHWMFHSEDESECKDELSKAKKNSKQCFEASPPRKKAKMKWKK